MRDRQTTDAAPRPELFAAHVLPGLSSAAILQFGAGPLNRNAVFDGRGWPVVFILPQLVLVALFFYWPALVAIGWSVSLERPFGGGSDFVGLDNFRRILSDRETFAALGRSLAFMTTASVSSILVALVLACAADRKLKLSRLARNVVFWPKAIAGAATGVIFLHLFSPAAGLLSWLNALSPGLWAPGLNGLHAFLLVNFAFVWNNVPFDFVVLLAGLQAVPPSLHEAAALDGAGPWRRLRAIQIPLLTPQLFLCLIVGISESFTSAFALIDSMTQGGPGGATAMLVYKIYVDGFKGYDLSGSSAQSVVLMVVIAGLTLLQFRLLERRVNYERSA